MSQLKIQKNKIKIAELLNKNVDLAYAMRLKSAYKIEDIEIEIGPKNDRRKVPARMMHWYEWFQDEDRPNEKGIRVSRKNIIEIDGVRTDGYRKIQYFTPDDINDAL